jgi:hypothetical protein
VAQPVRGVRRYLVVRSQPTPSWSERQANLVPRKAIVRDVEPGARSETQRNAGTQNFFRSVNERITTINHSMDVPGDGPDRPLEILCECGSPDCAERIELTHAEYERVRSNPTHFLLLAGHETEAVEQVVTRTERYLIAANHGEAEAIARDADPRRVVRRGR